MPPTPTRKKTADLLVLFVLAGLAALYGIDAFRASSEVLNLIMILPVTVAILILCAIQFVLVLAGKAVEPEPGEPLRQVFPIMLLFAAYVLSLPWLGFDVGTFAFLCAFLWMSGERRLPWLLGYSIAFAGLMAWFFAKMLPYPMPMLLLSVTH